jgi:bud emergence protein 1
MHDFNAERADELDAKAGDNISVVAQSNREWFVAKPIGRLGRAGLIPVSFVEVRDPATNQPIQDVESLMDSGILPRVEDWKRNEARYKQGSISLGVIEGQPIPNSPFMSPLSPVSSSSSAYPSSQNQSMSQVSAPRAPSPVQLPEGILLSADVVSFHHEADDYWFRVDAIYQPYDPAGVHRLPNAKQLVLFRSYNDFYGLQVSLLKLFPREAGKEEGYPRSLPFMPGPSDKVDDHLTAERRKELNDYIHNLCALNRSQARHVLESQNVRDFLVPKPGDVDHDIPPRTKDIEALSAPDVEEEEEPLDDYTAHVDAIADGDYETAELEENMNEMTLNQPNNPQDEGSDYEDEGYASIQHGIYNHKNPEYANGSDPAHTHTHPGHNPRNKSQSSFHQSYTHHAHTSSRDYARDSGYQPDYTNYPAQPRPIQTSADRMSGYSRSTNSHHARDQSISSPTSSTRSRSASVALNAPPISVNSQQTAFVKIKVFDRITDDLIALRVHPRVSHRELMEKVQARLGNGVHQLRYRDSVTNDYVELTGDIPLRQWIEMTDNHILFADS